MDEVRRFQVAQGRRLFSATHEEILSGATSDVYFQKGYDILRRLGRQDTPVVAEVFARRPGLLAGVEEVANLMSGRVTKLEALAEGSEFAAKEVVMRLTGPYGEFGVFETSLLGILASSSGWATAAHACVAASEGRPVISFGGRHVHPAVASVMDRAAVVGGAKGASTVLGAALVDMAPTGTVPHAVVLVAGDTLSVARVLCEQGQVGERTVLVDTFNDEAQEAVAVAEAVGDLLEGVRLDTPSERGGVTPELVAEVRARLDQKGRSDVAIVCSGSLNPERIATLGKAGATAFGVGHYISSAPPIDMTLDIKEVDGQPMAKRGRIPGATATQRLKPVLST